MLLIDNVYRDINRTQVARKKEAIAYFSIESAVALLISLFINLCVVSVFAKGFYGKGAGDIGLKNAGDYLGERFGSHMVSTQVFPPSSLSSRFTMYLPVTC